MADIFSPTMLGDIALNSRIVMAPMTRDRAGVGDVPTAAMVDYYRQRSGAGLVITEGVQPSPEGKGYWRTPGIYTTAQIDGWREVSHAVHARGGRIVMQLMHVGRAAVTANKDADAETVAPSAIASPDKIPGPDGIPAPPALPRALETDEVGRVIEEFVQAASNAIEAGMDGVELHCASGYLPMQFLSSNSNLRTDRYGGSVQNRVRFVVELLSSIADAIGPGRVGFRICPGVRYNGMADEDPAATYAALLRALEPLGLAYCHLIHIPMDDTDALDLVRANWTGSIIENQGQTLSTARQVLADGKADAVSFGYLFIANPDLVERFRHDLPLAKADRATFYSGLGDDSRGYTDYPRHAAD